MDNLLKIIIDLLKLLVYKRIRYIAPETAVYVQNNTIAVIAYGITFMNDGTQTVFVDDIPIYAGGSITEGIDTNRLVKHTYTIRFDTQTRNVNKLIVRAFKDSKEFYNVNLSKS